MRELGVAPAGRFVAMAAALTVACVVGVPRAAEAAPDPPSLSVQLNGNAFRPGDVMELRVSLLAGAQPAIADAYVVLQTPDQTYLSLQLGGSLVPGVVPIARGLTAQNVSIPIWTVAIPQGTPSGEYRWLSAVTQTGTANIYDGISEVRFRIGGSPSTTPFVGLNFSPFMFDQNPELGAIASPTQITARLATIAPWTQWIRLFGTGGGLDRAPALAKGLGLRVACAAWLSSNPAANDAELTTLEALGRAEQCDLLIVGSETLYRGDLLAARLVAYIARVKAAVPGVDVTTADTSGKLLEPGSASVLAAVDVVLHNTYPYWEGTSLAQAPAQLASRHAALVAAAPGKRVIVSETGWPTCGNPVGAAIPSPDNAARYLSAVLAWARTATVDVFYFSAFDEQWKTTREGPQGACWGVWDRLGNIKPAMVPVLRGAP